MGFQSDKKTMAQLRRVAIEHGAVAETITRSRNNGVSFATEDGGKAFILHNTCVVKALGKGGVLNVLVNTGGFSSMTTRRAINEALRTLGLGLSIGSYPGRNKIADNVCGVVPFNRTLLIRIEGRERRYYGDVTEQTTILDLG